MFRQTASESREAAVTGLESVGAQRSPAGTKPPRVMARVNWTRLGALESPKIAIPAKKLPKKPKVVGVKEDKAHSAGQIAHKTLARFKRPRGMEEPLRVMSTVLRFEEYHRFSLTRSNRDVLMGYVAKKVRYATFGGLACSQRMEYANDLLCGLVDRVWSLLNDSTVERVEYGIETRRARIKGRDLLFFVRVSSGGRMRILEVATSRKCQRYANRRRHPRQGRRHLLL